MPERSRKHRKRGKRESPDDKQKILLSSESTASCAIQEMSILPKRYQRQLTIITLACLIVFISMAVLLALYSQWTNDATQHGWLVMGLGYYITTALNTLGTRFKEAYEEMFYLRVELHRMKSKTLFDAVTQALMKQADEDGRACSSDEEAMHEYDEVSGVFKTIFRFWSSKPRTIQIRFKLKENLQRPDLNVHVEYLPGERVIHGRDQHMSRNEVIVIWMRTCPEKIKEHRTHLREWLDTSHARYVSPSTGTVKIHSLHETSTDWIPGWCCDRVKSCKTEEGKGHSFYLPRAQLDGIVHDARAHAKGQLRVYYIAGPPGTGKSEFTVWLAGQLAMHIYRVCLSSPRLTDERLAQLLSESSIRTSPILVQVDEFQETLERWMDEEGRKTTEQGVGAVGFCEWLQGSAALSKGVVVPTGTSNIDTDQLRNRLPHVFSRIHQFKRMVWAGKEDVTKFFRGFLQKFVSECPEDEWDRTLERLEQTGPWTSGANITLRMLKEYLMHRVTEASTLGVATQTGSDNCELFFTKANRKIFFDLMTDHEAAQRFLKDQGIVENSASALSTAIL